MKCRFCGYADCQINKQVISPYNQFTYSLYSCHSCGSQFFDPGEHEASLKQMYNDFSTRRGHFPQEFYPNKSWAKQVMITTRLLGRQPRSVLDVGCRTGDFLLHFDRNVQCEGIELSASFAEIARKRGLKVHNDFAENIDFTHKFDIVSCFALLEHIENPAVLLDRLVPVIPQGGLLVILIPTHQSLKTYIANMTGKSWHMYRPPEHLNLFSRKYLDQLLGQKNMALVKRYYTSGGMINPFPGIPIVNLLIRKSVQMIDNSFFNKIPFYDHMYSYYMKY